MSSTFYQQTKILPMKTCHSLILVIAFWLFAAVQTPAQTPTRETKPTPPQAVEKAASVPTKSVAEVMQASVAAQHSDLKFLRKPPIPKEAPIAYLGDASVPWSRSPATGSMPIVWNSDTGGYELSERAWNQAPLAIQNYTLYFLRAYNHLPASLRKTHSAAAVGTAAIIAEECVYSTNWSVFPDDVLVPATVVSILDSASEGLVHGIAEGKPAKDLVSAALALLCKVGENQSVPASFTSAEVLTTLPWERAINGIPLALDNITPAHPLSLKSMQERAEKVEHVTLSLMAQAAVAQARFTLLPSGAEERAGWVALADRAVTQVKEDLAARKAQTLVPSWTGMKTGPYVVATPQTLRPLAVILLAPAASEINQEWTRNGKAAAEAKLKEHPGFKKLCEIAGQVPRVEMGSKPELRGQTVFLGTITFINFARVDGLNDSTPIMEEVKIDLMAILPTGDGEPIRGFSSQAFVLARMPGGKPKWTRAAEIVTGMEVMGHAPMGNPGSGMTTRLDSNVHSQWYSVSKIRLYENVKGTVAIAHEGGWKLLVALPQHVLLDVGKSGVWVEAIKLDWGFTSYAGSDPDGKPLTSATIRTVQETEEPQTLVSLALTHENDELAAFANNVIVSEKADGSSPCATVECTSGDVSMVVETEELATATRSPDEKGDTHRVPLAVLKENPECLPNPKATIAEAYLEKPADCPWNFPPFLKGEAYITLKSAGTLLRAQRLVVEDANRIARDFICSRNTKLRAVASNGSVVGRRAFNVKAGDQLVAGFAPDGKTPLKIKAIRVEEIEMPPQRFISLVLANLKLAQCGPLVVEWECRETHQFNVGVAPETGLALAQPMKRSAKGASTTGTPDPNPPPFDASIQMAVSGSARADRALGRNLAIYDPMLKVIAAGALGRTNEIVLTRMVDIKVGNMLLRVAGSQSFLVHEKGAACTVSKPAYLLTPDDSLFIAGESAVTATENAIENVVPVFECGSKSVELLSASTEGWHKNLPIRSDICFGSTIAILMKALGPGASKARDTVRSPDDGQPGNRSGKFNGENQGDSPIKRPFQGGWGPVLTRDPADVLDLPSTALQMLRDRATLIHQSLIGEEGKVHTVRGRQNPRLQLLEKALQPGNWPYDEPSDKLGTILRGWVSQALHRRGAFLSAPNWRQLPEVCLQDVTLATWLNAAGCTETAGQFACDAVELSLFAGCTQKATSMPTVCTESGLGLVLAAGKWAAPGENKSPSYSVNPLATRHLVGWAKGLQMQDQTGKAIQVEPPTPRDGIVELNELFAIWEMRAGEANLDWPDYDNPKNQSRANFVDWLTRNRPQASH